VKAYAEAIDRLLSDKELYMKYATAGKDRIVRMFTSEHSNVQAEEVLTQLGD
jgi:glycosyltransferase involved in cell wall biosynthesis